LLAFRPTAHAHDIPSDITVHLLVRPAGQRLQLAVRVPLKAMRDLDFPERGNGTLDIERLVPELPGAATVWISNFVRIFEDGRQLDQPRVSATQISLDSDRSFTSFERAAAHIAGPRLSSDANVFWNQVQFDVLFEYAIGSDRSNFSIRPGLERLGARVLTHLRFLPPGGSARSYEFTGDAGLVPLDPRWRQAARRFVGEGFFHILDGFDHLLFLLCLVLPLRQFRALLTVVTAFTVAHSTTLAASVYDFAPNVLWFPPVIEMLIAVSIVYMAIENIIRGKAVHHRWIMAFAFGLVHGFGFSLALRDKLQFAGANLATALISFNVGVELGQILVIALLIPALELLFRFAVAERVGTIIVSAFVAHTGWHWTAERAEYLRKFEFQWPPLNAALLASTLRGLALILLAGGLARLTWTILRRHRAAKEE
jgi:hypothetical protein